MKKGLIIIFLVLPCYLFAQTGWDQSPLQLPTRWSKEVSPKNALPDYPRPQLVRSEWQNLNGLWSYAITDSGAARPDNFEGKILVPYPVESALSGVKKALQPSQQLWYQRTLELKKKEANKRYLLHFGAVDYQTLVYVNGKEIGEHTGGYQQFSFDITDALQKGNNTLTVLVWDPTDKGNNPHGKQVLNPGGIMYTSTSGIWQTVWMETVPEAYITSLKMTPDVDGGYLSLTVNTNENGADYTVEATAKGAGSVKGAPGQPLEIKIPDARLWSPDDPYLYDLRVKLVKGNKTTDEVKSYFGMRKIAIQKDTQGIDRIFLNNKFTYNLGVLDQGFWPDGIYTAPTDKALKFDIEAIKSMGFNTIRKHIKVEPARWYYWCDKLGMLVWQDMPYPANVAEGGKKEFETESKTNIEQLYDHPSIICWVLFNEGWNSYDQQRLTAWIKQQDPSRLIDGHTGANYCGTCGADAAQKWVDAYMTDIHDYPGPGIAPKLDGKAMVLGEWGGLGVAIADHDWKDEGGWGYVQLSPSALEGKYDTMMIRLKKLEGEGLSASIYTQPFDVETEENGLITYDREIIKIPVKEIRGINAMLLPPTSAFSTDFKIKDADHTDPAVRYKAMLQTYEQGNRDPEFLRKLAQEAKKMNDKANAYKFAADYIHQMKDPFTKDNLEFIEQFTKSTKDPGFSIFYDNKDKVNAILGKDASEALTTYLIEKDDIGPNCPKGGDPDWEAIEKNVVAQYGGLGKEISAQSRMIFDVNNGKWEDFGKHAGPWFEQYGKYRKWISAFFINGAAWTAFQGTADTAALKTALAMAKYGLGLEVTPELLDTYANLLYKTGNKDQAVQWEEKAVTAAPGNADIKAAFEKMKKGKQTWPAK